MLQWGSQELRNSINTSSFVSLFIYYLQHNINDDDDLELKGSSVEWREENPKSALLSSYIYIYISCVCKKTKKNHSHHRYNEKTPRGEKEEKEEEEEVEEE